MSSGHPIEANRQLWDAWTDINARSAFYDLEGFRTGRSSLQAIEIEEIGAVAGKSLLHLQCHFGLDTLSWARLGAKVTGVDLSPKAIELARSLAAELSLEARFICADVLALREVIDERFDIVFTSYGVLDWLPSLTAWAQVIAALLKPGGVFYIVEFHPLLSTLDDVGVARCDYFRDGQAVEVEERGSYADPEADYKGSSHTFVHTLGEIVSALTQAGLRLEFLHEFPFSPYDCFPFTELVEPGKAALRGHPAGTLPLLFSLRASRT